MAEGILIGVVSTLIVEAILFVVARVVGVFSIGKRLRRWETTVNRAKKDYGLWRDRTDRELADQLRKIDEDLNGRGVYDSSIRMQEHARANAAMQDRTKEQLTILTRSIDDAFSELRWVDRMVMALKYRGDHGRLKSMWTTMTKKPKSFEEDFLSPVLRGHVDENHS